MVKTITPNGAIIKASGRTILLLFLSIPLAGCMLQPIKFNPNSDGVEFTAVAPLLGNCQLSGVTMKNTTSVPLKASGFVYSLKGANTVSSFQFFCDKAFPGGSVNCQGAPRNLSYNIDGMCKHNIEYTLYK